MDDVTGKIIGAAIEVHKYLGPGLLESIYETALCYEMNKVGLKVQGQVITDIRYKDIIIQGQRIDVVVNEEIVVEVKSLKKLPDIATSQVLSYLHAMKLRRGLLINFGQHKLIDGIKRISL
jgi:GxxExxY protein